MLKTQWQELLSKPTSTYIPEVGINDYLCILFPPQVKQNNIERSESQKPSSTEPRLKLPSLKTLT